MTRIIGIDLGTTKSAVAVWHDGAPHIVPNAEGATITPSVVALDPESGRWLVGRRARALAVARPGAAAVSVKRLIGRRYGDAEVRDLLERVRLPYAVQESAQQAGGIVVGLGEVELTPQQVAAKILQQLRRDAGAYLRARGGVDELPAEAVITVPAYFLDSQRQATRDAGRIAGLEVRRVLNEPTAACLAFGYARLNEPRRTIAVYDLGGGTFDISILDVGRGPFGVRATSGIRDLGGDDMNAAVVAWLLRQIGGASAERLRADRAAIAQLTALAERAKLELTAREQTTIELGAPLPELALTLDRDELERIVAPVIARTLEPCAQALHDARLSPGEISEVLMVGGQTRMPAVRRAVRDFFGVEPNVSVNPEEVVALGAAVQAAIIAGEAPGLKLADVVPLSLGVNTRGRMDVLVRRNTRLPYEMPEPRVYSTVYNNQESVEIQIYQGERPLVADNTKLGGFILHGIEPAPAGEPEIAVTFRVDQDGIVHVVGRDLRSGNEQQITITDTARLSDEEVEALRREAEERAAEYAALYREAELRDEVELLAERLRDLLAPGRPALPAGLDAEVAAALAEPGDDLAERGRRLRELWARAGQA